MSKLMDALLVTKTENDAMTYLTTTDAVLDVFFAIGGMRFKQKESLIELFEPAMKSNPELSLKLLFYIRDVRSGQGERKAFRILLSHLVKQHPQWITTDFVYWVAHYGRWDDVFELLDVSPKKDALVANILRSELDSGNALLAKWMPREKSAKKALASRLRKLLGWTSKEYRQKIANVTQVVESQMCAQQWDDIEFSKVPSLAHLRYRKRFGKLPKYLEYLESVSAGKETIHSGTLYPYNLVQQILSGVVSNTDRLSIEQQWKALPNYLKGTGQYRILPLVDVSGSMNTDASPSALEVAISLGLYLSERNTGIYQDCFLTFSKNPKLCQLKSDSIVDRVYELNSADWGMNTDLEKALLLILTRAKEARVPPEEMPTHLLILSDMHFDNAVNANATLFETLQSRFEQYGYQCPQVIFWNLDARGQNFPVQKHQSGAALVSGFSPSLMTALLSNNLDSFSPRQVMLDTLCSERYARVVLPKT